MCDHPPPSRNGQFCLGSDLQIDYCNKEDCPSTNNCLKYLHGLLVTIAIVQSPWQLGRMVIMGRLHIDLWWWAEEKIQNLYKSDASPQWQNVHRLQPGN